MEAKLYPFINDLVFKCVFGQQKNAKLLICLLNALLHRKGPRAITEIEILNPFNLQEFKGDKLTIVDVKARSKLEDWFTIEIQAESHPSYVARSVYYLAF
jgi:predicted transposase/invertase (TIGR01784 family)